VVSVSVLLPGRMLATLVDEDLEGDTAHVVVAGSGRDLSIGRQTTHVAIGLDQAADGVDLRRSPCRALIIGKTDGIAAIGVRLVAEPVQRVIAVPGGDGRGSGLVGRGRGVRN